MQFLDLPQAVQQHVRPTFVPRKKNGSVSTFQTFCIQSMRIPCSLAVLINAAHGCTWNSNKKSYFCAKSLLLFCCSCLQMDDLDAMFSDLLGEMDLLTQVRMKEKLPLHLRKNDPNSGSGALSRSWRFYRRSMTALLYSCFELTFCLLFVAIFTKKVWSIFVSLWLTNSYSLVTVPKPGFFL